MSSPNQGLWSTLAMFIPLLAVPFLAAIGIPQFTPTAASSEDEPPDLGELQRVEIGVGESLHHGADDLFAPFTKPQRRSNPAESEAPPADGESRWNDPFQQWNGGQTASTRDPRAMVALGEPQVGPATSSADWSDRTRSSANAGRRLHDHDSGGSSPAVGAPTHEWLSLDAESPFGSRERQPRPAPPERSRSGSDSSGDRPLSAEDSPFSPGAARGERGRPDNEKPLTWHDARRRLSELGIRDFQLNPGRGEGEFHFGCTFAAPESPRVVHRFEAEAPEPLAAVEKVIRQIEAWRGRR